MSHCLDGSAFRAPESGWCTGGFRHRLISGVPLGRTYWGDAGYERVGGLFVAMICEVELRERRRSQVQLGNEEGWSLLRRFSSGIDGAMPSSLRTRVLGNSGRGGRKREEADG